MIKKEVYRFLAAIVFFTRIPVPRSIKLTDEHFNKSARYLTWVGLIIASAGVLILYLGLRIFPVSVALIITLLINTLITGALHEDGLADFCDGFGGGYDKTRILEIMKDSNSGSYGIIALILSYALRYLSLLAMPVNFLIHFYMLAAILSRFTLVLTMYQYSYARLNGNGKSGIVSKSISISDVIIAAIPILLLPFLISEYSVLLLLIPVWITQIIMSRYIHRKIGGYTGDCLGAMQQITEIVFYLSALVWLRFI